MNRSGQIALVGALLLIILLLAVPAVILVNQFSTHHGTSSLKKSKGRAIAEEGIAFAVQQLSSATIVALPGQSTGNPGAGPAANGDNARYVWQDVPLVMAPGQTAGVSLTFENTGTQTWGANHRITNLFRITNPSAPSWTGGNPDLFPLNPTETILPTRRKNFTFPVTAPTVLGNYEFLWSMWDTATPGLVGYASPKVTISVQSLPSPPPYWPYANPTGSMPPGGVFRSAQGGSFRITYSSAPNTGLENYQVGVLSVPLEANGDIIPGSSLFAVVSQKTLGVKLPSGYSASAALTLERPPTPAAGGGGSGGLAVHWGPVAVFDTANPPVTWTLRDIMDVNRFPRKFVVGGITGTGSPPAYPRSADEQDTDGKEYWANTSIGFPSAVDLATYNLRSKDGVFTSAITAPVLKSDGVTPVPRACPVSNTNCGNFIVPVTDTAVFHNYTLDLSSAVIYVEGNAAFQNIAIDLADSGAFIVTGNLDLETPGPGAGQVQNLRFPITAPADYPYAVSTPRWPCDGNVTNNVCPSASTQLGLGATNALGTGGGNGGVHFRGFLYVQRNFTCVTPTSAWLFAGAMRVDGIMNVSGPFHRLSLLYDDTINHRILTAPIEIIVDSLTVVP